jgi:3-deoxy-D-arabino-heptulosonate 7-phosphate (DAHP) synthase
VRQGVRAPVAAARSLAEAAPQVQRVSVQVLRQGLQLARGHARAPRVHPPEAEAVQVPAVRLLHQVRFAHCDQTTFKMCYIT